MNTVICTHRDNLSGKLKRTTIVYLDPPATWRVYALEAVGAVVLGTAFATVYLAVVVLRVVL